MPLITGAEIERVVRLFENRGVYFFHACQLKDFKTYLRMGGIASRQAMERERLPFTPFDTDGADHRSGTWSKVFGNLSDFGAGFAWGEKTKAVPNPYGPILLALNPSALSGVDDMAICLRSAGAQGFNREAESLGSSKEVDRIFQHPYDRDEPYANAYLKRSEDLRSEFQDRVGSARTPGWKTLNPEVSCTVTDELIPFNELHHVVVDGYSKDSTTLVSLVNDVLVEHGLSLRPLLRRYRRGANREVILRDIVHASQAGVLTPDTFAAAPDLSQESKDWIKRVQEGKLGWQFGRYAKYLHDGTLSEMDE